MGSVSRQASILAVEDDPTFLKYLSVALAGPGRSIEIASTAAETLSLLQSRIFDLVLLDLRLPDSSGTELLRKVKEHDPAVEVIVLTGNVDLATAVEAVKLGAYDYLVKPVEHERLSHLVERVLEHRALREEVRSLRSRLTERLTQEEIVGVSPGIRRVKELVAQVAPSDSNVVIEGETGTGKEMVAASIHRLSSRRERPFLAVNCAAIPAELLESELFGHVRGAFSGAIADFPGLFRAADGGTLFLDELTDLPPPMQAKLLRVLQEREVRPVGSVKSYPIDVRIVAASSRPLQEAVRAGQLRQDFFYRLSVVSIHLPPLRERKEDIAPLVTSFLRRLGQRRGREVRGVAPAALAALQAHDFPGNVRELQHIVERACALGARDEIGAEDLPLLAPAPVRTEVTSPTLHRLAEAEKAAIAEALRLYNQDKDAAARSLGISRRTLYRRLKQFGLRRDES